MVYIYERNIHRFNANVFKNQIRQFSYFIFSTFKIATDKNYNRLNLKMKIYRSCVSIKMFQSVFYAASRINANQALFKILRIIRNNL